MKNKITGYCLLVIVAMSMLISSCINDEDWFELNSPLRVDIRSSGLFIVNEGNFMYDNASLSYYDIDSMKVLNQVFFRTNGTPLGDVAYSMQIRDSLGYIVINNSGKIYIIDINTFEYRGRITGLTSPRYIHFISDTKAYVTDLYAKSVAVINPQTFEITGHIDVHNGSSEFYQHSTEEMVKYGRYVFTNCWSFDNKILVIDTMIDRLVDSIEVTLQPVSIKLDRYNKLWVLSDGSFEGSAYGWEAAALTRIDAETRLVEKVIRLGQDDLPSSLCMNGSGDTLYFLNRHVYCYPVRSEDEPEILVESSYSQSLSGYFGLIADPGTSDLYVADAIDFMQQGSVYRYRSDGTPVDTFQAGIAPGAFCFKRIGSD